MLFPKSFFIMFYKYKLFPQKGHDLMEKKPHLMAIVLFLTGLICIGLLFGLSYKTYQKIDAADQKMTSVIEPVKTKQKAMKEEILTFIQPRSKRNRQPTNICSNAPRLNRQ